MMILRIFIILIMAATAVNINAQTSAANEIVKKVDSNLSSENKIVVSKMIIHGRRGDRTIESKSWIRGTQKSFTEYLAPAREKGTKMLKLEDQLWMYSPGTDRIIQISGHMLRQSVMGSDLSYEDMMEDAKLHMNYESVILKKDTLDNRSCWILELQAVDKDVAYPVRKLWVDMKRYIPLKEELYARSGKLLKNIELKDVREMDGRWYPTRMIFKDVLKEGRGTEFIVEDIQFNADIPDYIFSKASLRR